MLTFRSQVLDVAKDLIGSTSNTSTLMKWRFALMLQLCKPVRTINNSIYYKAEKTTSDELSCNGGLMQA